MRTLTRLGLGAAACTVTLLAAAGCSNSGTSGNDMAMPVVDLATGGGMDGFRFDLPPLPDIAGDTAVVRLSVGFEQPFGAVFDAATNAWYISNVSGDLSNFTNLKDGRGWITKISADYKTVDHSFYTTGMNAPAGLRIYGGKLYVPDVDQLVVIDLQTRAAVRSMTVTPQIFLIPYVAMTDVDVDSTGTAYASETVGNRILKFAMPTMPASGYTSYQPAGVMLPTTVLIDGTKLIVGTTGNPMMAGSLGALYTMNLIDGSMVKSLGTLAANYQGIEKDGTDYMIGTTRAHTVNRINQVSGQNTLLRDFGMDGVYSIGDLGWDPVGRVLAVTDVSTNAVYFYKM
jgi:hypothetical protein